MADVHLDQGMLHNLHSPPLECPPNAVPYGTLIRARGYRRRLNRTYLDMSLDLGLQLLKVLHDRPVDSAT